MDHTLRPAHRKCHVQGVKHHLGGESRGHRPANDATAAGIEHDRQIKKARPGRNVGNVGDPQLIQSFRREVARDQVRRLTPAAFAGRRGDELASAHTGNTRGRHQPSDPLATDTDAFGRKLGMNTRCSVGAARSLVRGVDLRHQRAITAGTPRWLPLGPRIVAAGGDAQESAHGGDRISGLVVAHEPEPFGGIVFVSRANQAAAFERMSRSSFS